ncbi:hypothetical protein Lfu02_40590 [Longispora fulva]|uniref:Lipoprotein n=1 Tax=Longispora fulva TaxID=619741 RepID=A0A8J7KWF7_9ACTN|nr:hypothetical protein [Longispora fulva]MBG6136517.1 hypothetical protein [Longispora fulva]GIG59687.1 hypothetical protein Lfu02_40590 [Longispora fulva]
MISKRSTKLTRGVATALTALLLLAGCGTSDKEKPLQTRSKDDAAKQVETYFRDLAVLVTGNPEAPSKKFGLGPAPCEGRNGEAAKDDRFYVLGTYSLRLSSEQHKAALDKLREDWRNKHYEITEDLHQVKDGTWSITVRNPADGFNINADEPNDENIGFMITSPCYLPNSS